MTTPAMTQLKQIGEAVRRERSRRNLSQAGLGKQAGLTARTVLEVEAGRPGMTTALLLLMDALDISVSVHQGCSHEYEPICRLCGTKAS